MDDAHGTMTNRPVPHPVYAQNRRIFETVQSRSMTSLRESIREQYGLDVDRFNFTDPFFSWSTLRESSRKLSRRLREASSETTFGQLLRAGVQTIANGWYQAVPVTYRGWVQEVASTKRQEFYAPLHRAGYPRRLGEGQKFPQTRVDGLDVMIVNEKFGAIIGFSRELFDDDQTGQIAQRASQVGENMALLEEIWVYQRFIGTVGEYLGDPIPESKTRPANEPSWPFSTSFIGGGRNRPTTYARFSRAALIEAWQGLYQQRDLLGNRLLVQPDTILVSPIDHFDALTILNSTYFPSVPSTTAGATGVQFAQNVLQGLANLVTSRYLPDRAWAYGQAGRGFIFQRRDPMELIQENPTAGAAFEQDEYRFRARARWEPDWLDPRLWWLGSDGSV